MQRYRLKAIQRGEIYAPKTKKKFKLTDQAPFCLVLAPCQKGTHGTAVMVDYLPLPEAPTPSWLGGHVPDEVQREYENGVRHASEYNVPHSVLLKMLSFTRGYATWIDLYPTGDYTADVEIWSRGGNLTARIYGVHFVNPLVRHATHSTEAVPYDGAHDYVRETLEMFDTIAFDAA